MADEGEAAGEARHAIYFVPAPDTPLWAFGSSVLGYDAASTREVDFPASLVDDFAWEAVTREARRYGFHATLKAPFELAHGVRQSDLLTAVQSFTAATRVVSALEFEVRGLERFVALVPVDRSDALHELADACVRIFDVFRAPLSDADRQRRLKSPLSARQRRYMHEWGYPFVLEEFRFHMTLTGPLGPDHLEPARRRLVSLYARIAQPVAVDAIAVAVQPNRSAPFRVLRRFPLLG